MLSLSLQFVCVESLVTAVVDMYPKVFRRGYRRELLILALSIISYFLGLVMLTEVSDGSSAPSNSSSKASDPVAMGRSSAASSAQVALPFGTPGE